MPCLWGRGVRREMDSEALQDVGRLLVDVQRNCQRLRQALSSSSGETATTGRGGAAAGPDLEALLRSLETDLQHKACAVLCCCWSGVLQGHVSPCAVDVCV